MKQAVAIVGLGEVGKPLLELMAPHHNVVGIDLELPERIQHVDVLHVCYPFEISDFIGETARYIDLFRPPLTIINSTVAVGTTRKIAERTGASVVNSPVRGKHVRMLQELQTYVKFIGALDERSALQAEEHFRSVGVKTKILASPEATELAKLSETTYFGVLIAWAQEIERYCDRSGVSYDEVASFFEEINYLPRVKFWPGVIGGHCVMPNIEILRPLEESPLLEAIRISNQMKINRDNPAPQAVGASTSLPVSVR